jgi:hypothetical protein
MAVSSLYSTYTVNIKLYSTYNIKCHSFISTGFFNPKQQFIILPYIIWIIPKRSHLIWNSISSILKQFQNVNEALIIQQGKVHWGLTRVIHNLGFKELGDVEDDAEDDDRDDVDDDSLGDTPGLGEISVFVRVAYTAIPKT